MSPSCMAAAAVIRTTISTPINLSPYPPKNSSGECEEVMRLAKPRLYRSGVANAETGESLLSDIRTSKGERRRACLQRVEGRRPNLSDFRALPGT